MSTPGRPPDDASECGLNAAPYVLGALPPEEYESFSTHLQSCAICREEVAALQIVADALPAVAPQIQAPAHLKDEIMASVREDALQERRPEPRRARSGWPASLSWRPGAAIAGVAVLAAAVLAIVLAPGGGAPASERVIMAQVLAPRATASVRVHGARAELRIAGMPQTPPGRVYEVWVKRNGAAQPTDALFTVTTNGSATVGVPGSISGVKVIMVTSEPLGGSRVPSSPPVIVAKLA